MVENGPQEIWMRLDLTPPFNASPPTSVSWRMWCEYTNRLELMVARAAVQAGVLFRLHVRRQELLNAMALTYFLSVSLPGIGQVWKMVPSSHHLHVMKAKLNGQTTLHAMMSKICRCGISPLEFIFIFLILEVWVKTKMSVFEVTEIQTSSIMNKKIDIWLVCFMFKLCWCLFAVAFWLISVFYICILPEVEDTIAF